MRNINWQRSKKQVIHGGVFSVFEGNYGDNIPTSSGDLLMYLSERRSVEAQIVSLHVIEFDVESAAADRELGLQDLGECGAELPVHAGAEPADGHDLAVSRGLLAPSERRRHAPVYRNHDVGFWLADDLGERPGAVLEDVGGDNGVHRHVRANAQLRHRSLAAPLRGVGIYGQADKIGRAHV